MSSKSKEILGESKPIKDLIKMIDKVAAARTSVLVIGESGTGKELVARMIHDRSPMKGKNFVPVNCGAIPENLIESELFGHKRGSFTGAVSDKPGLFEVADGGTLFLDEIGELPLTMQVKLLRALQDRSIRRVGATEDIKVDARIIAATNRDLEAAVKKGTFREDLYYRLNVILIRTPPLRERPGDMELLARVFLKRFAEKQQKNITELSPQAWSAMKAYAWPGNVRELENVLERAITLSADGVVPASVLPSAIREANPASLAVKQQGVGGSTGSIELPAPDFSRGPISLEEVLSKVEKIYLEAALEHAGGVRKSAAELLGITFRSIRYRLKKQGVAVDGDEPAEDDAE